MKKLFFLFMLTLVFSCTPPAAREEFSAGGRITNATGEMIYLSELQAKKTFLMDSAKIGEDGRFRFSKPLKTRSFFILTIGNQKLILIPDKGDEIQIEGDRNKSTATYQISGSADTELLQEFFRRSEPNRRTTDSLRVVLRDHENMDDMVTVGRAVDSVFARTLEHQRNIQRQMIRSNPESLANLLILNYTLGSEPVLDPEKDFEYFDQTDSMLMKRYPENPHVIFHHSRMEALRGMMQLKKDIQQKK